MDNKKHSCQLPFGEFEWLGNIYRVKCIGKIEGKVLKVETAPDDYDKSNELCIKIRINKWGEWGEGREESKKHLVYYGLDNPWGKNKPPREGETYWFWLHEREKKTSKGFKHDQRNWQWTHDWQIIEK